MPAQLVALTEGPSILLDKPILLVGRHPECDIQINSRKISRLHCCIAQVSDYLVVRDLGSTNGIRINGVRVIEGRLHGGDELTIGSNRYNIDWEAHGTKHPVAAPKQAAPVNKHHPGATVPRVEDEKPRPVPRPAPPAARPAPVPGVAYEDLDSFDEPVPIAERAPAGAPLPTVRPAYVPPAPPPPHVVVPAPIPILTGQGGHEIPMSTAKPNLYAQDRPMPNGPRAPLGGEPPGSPAAPALKKIALPPSLERPVTPRAIPAPDAPAIASPKANPAPPPAPAPDEPSPLPTTKGPPPPPMDNERIFSMILPEHLELTPASEEAQRRSHKGQ